MRILMYQIASLDTREEIPLVVAGNGSPLFHANRKNPCLSLVEIIERIAFGLERKSTGIFRIFKIPRINRQSRGILLLSVGDLS